jgi:hypothetical protein
MEYTSPGRRPTLYAKSGGNRLREVVETVKNSSRRRVRLEYSEGVAVRVDKVRMPAHTRHRELGQSDFAAEGQDLVRHSVDIRYLDLADIRIRPTLRKRSRCGALEQAAANTFGFDPPVGDGHLDFASEALAEQRLIKRDRILRI